MELDQVDIDPKGSINLDEEEFVEINSKSIADDYINLLSRKGGLKQNNSTYDPKGTKRKLASSQALHKALGHMTNSLDKYLNSKSE